MGREFVTDPSGCRCMDELFACFHDPAPSLNTLRRAFTLLARWPFSSPDNMTDEYKEALECLVWSPVDKDSKVKITPSSVVDPGNTSNVPGILVSIPEGLRLERAGITDTSGTLSDFSGRFQSYMGEATVVFTCRHIDADVACMMADLLMLFMTAVQERMYETFRWLRDYRPAGVTEPKITAKEGDPDTKWYESVFSLRLAIEYDVFTTREAPRLRGIDVIVQPKPLSVDGNYVDDPTIVSPDGVWGKHHA